jgi:predicted HTH transcriptional regulator
MESAIKATQGTTRGNEKGRRVSLSAIENDKSAIGSDKAAIENDRSAIERDKSTIEGDKPAIEKVDRIPIILHYLEQNEKGKNSDFAKLLGLSPPRIRAILQSLVEENLIEKHGKNRYTYYTLKDSV